MSEYEDLKADLLAVMDSVHGYGTAVNRYADLVNEQVAKLWQDNAELRDELHALANRVETLTRAVMADPADVARAIVNDANRSTLREVFVCRLNPGCNISRPHVHDESGAVILVSTEEVADTYLSQRAQRDAILGLHRRKS